MSRENPDAPNADMREAGEKRTSPDRRQVEQGPPTRFERRRSIERRQPEVEELHLSAEDLEPVGLWASIARMRPSEVSFCRIRRSIVVLWGKKTVKNGPLRRIRSRRFQSPTGS